VGLLVRTTFIILASVFLVTFTAGCSDRSSDSPIQKPGVAATTVPMKVATNAPTGIPTLVPTKVATAAPTAAPTARPTVIPTTVLKALPTSKTVTIKEYGSYMANQFAKLNVALKTVSTLSYQAAENPRLLTERGDWLVDMSYALSDVEIAANNIQKAGPVPPELKALDDQAKSIGFDLENAASDYFDGLDKLDPDVIRSSAATFQSVNARLATYNADLKAFIDSNP